jgi:hypothetical protein
MYIKYLQPSACMLPHVSICCLPHATDQSIILVRAAIESKAEHNMQVGVVAEFVSFTSATINMRLRNIVLLALPFCALWLVANFLFVCTKQCHVLP